MHLVEAQLDWLYGIVRVGERAGCYDLMSDHRGNREMDQAVVVWWFLKRAHPADRIVIVVYYSI